MGQDDPYLEVQACMDCEIRWLEGDLVGWARLPDVEGVLPCNAGEVFPDEWRAVLLDSVVSMREAQRHPAFEAARSRGPVMTVATGLKRGRTKSSKRKRRRH